MKVAHDCVIPHECLTANVRVVSRGIILTRPVYPRLAAYGLHSERVMKLAIIMSVVLVAVITVARPCLASSQHKSAASTSATSQQQAPEDSLGLGVMLGNMNGISGKFWLSGQSAIDAGLSYTADNYATVHADYLWNLSDLVGLPARDRKHRSVVAPYFGIGAILFVDTSNGNPNGDQGDLYQKLKSTGLALGVRVPVGFEFLPASIPCGVFGEIAAGTVLIPGTVGVLDGEVGVRFYM